MLTEVLDRIAFDCPWRTPPGKQPPDHYDAKCKLRFTDLDRNRHRHLMDHRY